MASTEQSSPTELVAPTELSQYGETPDTNYPRFGTGLFLPTDGNQLATWLQENTWAAAWSRDANEAREEDKVDLPLSPKRRN